MDRKGQAGGWPAIAVALAVALFQLPLILNPGYFSHDELQWAAHATDPAFAMSVEGIWRDTQIFQYRPLTFSLWIWLSRLLFDQPFAFHAVLVAWGALNAAMLTCLLCRFGLATRPAVAAALVFAMSAFAVQTHGWIGTIGDLSWVSCALLVGLLAQRDGARWALVAGSGALTAIALLSKEAGIVIPALTALGWLMLGRRPAWAWATLGSGVVAALYLGLRLDAILFTPRTTTNYEWSAWFVPLRWAEYQLFPPMATRAGITGLLPEGFASPRVWFAGLVWLAMAWTFWRAGARWLLAFVLIGAAALGPVLILAESANQYGYGFAAAIAGLGAALWSRTDRTGRIVLVLAALLSVWHGVNVMRRMHEVGELQSRFSPAMAQAVSAADHYPVRLRALDPGQHWIYLRLSHQIHSYHGVAIGDRVQLVASDAPADYVIGKDGALTPAR
ncbi:hypothetical protein JI752_015165 [Lysobacter sp. MMG2]|uniref:hypothetical protein n=1 Tax=Lysobacter sp. MMG2 TaxID=2801338 RepID=UPI001C235F51|nr:hypothetical protein [Lysobacter sp. MMG2]MBU8977489.1 hypothetical protein [Lysobacter sp. MMG2]